MTYEASCAGGVRTREKTQVWFFPHSMSKKHRAFTHLQSLVIVPSALQCLPPISVPSPTFHIKDNASIFLYHILGLTTNTYSRTKVSKRNRSVVLWKPVPLLWSRKSSSDFFKTLSSGASLSPWLCDETCALKIRGSGAEKSNTSLSLNYSLSLQNNKVEKPTCNRISAGWWQCTADRWVTTNFGGFSVGCFGFLILYILGLENARNLLAEQVYSFSNQALFHWGKFPQQALLPKQHTVQWDSLNLKQILWKGTVHYTETESSWLWNKGI